MTPDEFAAKLLALLRSDAARDLGFEADPIEDQPNVIGVEVGADLFFVEVQPA